MITSFRLTLILLYLYAETKERMSSGDDGFMFAVSLYCIGRLGERNVGTLHKIDAA